MSAVASIGVGAIKWVVIGIVALVLLWWIWSSLSGNSINIGGLQL